MAAASNGSPNHNDHFLSPDQATDRFKSLEAKVVILGCQGVGKTSLVIRNMGGGFTSNVTPTIGASFFSFTVTVAGFRVKLQVWDTAGQERFRSMAPMYYRRANAAIIVYDITSEKSFDEARQWIKEVQSKVESTLAMSVVGNKSDLDNNRMVSRDRGEDLAHSLGGMFTETSAAENTGVKEAFLKVAQGVIELHQNQMLKSASVSSAFTPFSGTLSPLVPPSQTNGTSNTYLYQTNSIDDTNKRVVDIENVEDVDKGKSSMCC